MSRENFSLSETREESGLKRSDVERFQKLFGKIRRGVQRKDLAAFWEFLKDKTDGQLEALSAVYNDSLSEEKKQQATLPATYETLKRMTRALEVVLGKPQEPAAPFPEELDLRTAPERNSGQELSRQLNRRLAGKATDQKELQTAVDDPKAFWKMMESL